jgi:long-chain acyl-CoA synthetase
MYVAGDMDQYLHYIGGPAGALALTGVAAASAYYLVSRPTPEKPLVELDEQSYIVPVSKKQLLTYK